MNNVADDYNVSVGSKWRDLSGDLDGSLTSGATGGDDSCTGEFPSAEGVNY